LSFSGIVLKDNFLYFNVVQGDIIFQDEKRFSSKFSGLIAKSMRLSIKSELILIDIANISVISVVAIAILCFTFSFNMVLEKIAQSVWGLPRVPGAITESGKFLGLLTKYVYQQPEPC
jgi:hypothetical protein